ncbi:uncharacterized protein L203_103403 [Cryptococcus depauperatus CBS 7841]|uniref:Uncharacterized protein n=1 Tax=Cryptococcus depauperatus CBS 7841 TaxID=1295531 RepID=A0AAJ8M217_9TREE
MSLVSDTPSLISISPSPLPVPPLALDSVIPAPPLPDSSPPPLPPSNPEPPPRRWASYQTFLFSSSFLVPSSDAHLASHGAHLA